MAGDIHGTREELVALLIQQRRDVSDMLAALRLAQDIIGHPDDEGSKFIASVIAKAEGTTP